MRQPQFREPPGVTEPMQQAKAAGQQPGMAQGDAGATAIKADHFGAHKQNR